ncbi:hypothetical protein ACT17_15130 [Mycolicibacterium conceptionense]|uniref:Transmembrane protein n=1 Tax=Mycolicibacterium conceptionense TaxID=451644 RepID=A0A0J8WX58_9MYCO|nr:hypothetical protein [Mycolicibacterium conceptionense]KMV17614.1 hypothetical protein ACT17_15130 [Mycolicibacterium conceptionense]
MTDPQPSHQIVRAPWWVPAVLPLVPLVLLTGFIAAVTAGLWAMVAVFYGGGYLLRLLGPVSGGLSMVISSAIMLGSVFSSILGAVLVGRAVMRGVFLLVQRMANEPPRGLEVPRSGIRIDEAGS